MKISKQNLRIPGPTPCPDEIMELMSSPMINHRGPEFKELLYSVTDRLKRVFQTGNDLYILTASGTGALEASLVNTLSPGDEVIAAVTGSFGRRYADMAEAVGASVTRLDFEWGTAVDVPTIRHALEAQPDVKAVLVTHNETSTGVINDLEAVAAVVKGEFDKLLLVDAVSSLGCVSLPVDRWRCDVVATASQKGFLTPPGLSFISFGPGAWEARKSATATSFYFDLATAQTYLERGQTPFTPNLPLFYALDRSLDVLLDEGLEETYTRHAYFGDMTRRGVKALGLQLLPDDHCASNTVTAVRIPSSIDAKTLVNTLRLEHGVVVGGGLGELEGKIIRIGHLGAVSEPDIVDCLEALGKTLESMGFRAGD